MVVEVVVEVVVVGTNYLVKEGKDIPSYLS